MNSTKQSPSFARRYCVAAPYKVSQRACGDFAVQRFDHGVVKRWGTYPAEKRAKLMCRAANSGLITKDEADVMEVFLQERRAA